MTGAIDRERMSIAPAIDICFLNQLSKKRFLLNVEDQKQCLLQLVQQYRFNFPDSRKQSLWLGRKIKNSRRQFNSWKEGTLYITFALIFFIFKYMPFWFLCALNNSRQRSLFFLCTIFGKNFVNNMW